MAVDIVLRRNKSEANRLVKSFIDADDINLSGVFVEPNQDILHPSIRVRSDVNLSGYNYAEIIQFGRKYFMHPTVEVNGIWRLDCDVDVLSTYYNGIMNSEAVVKRTEELDKINYYINDNVFFTEQRERVTFTKFKKVNATTGEREDAKFGSDAYYLIVAGG